MITEYNSLIGKIKVSDYSCEDTYYDIAERLSVPYKNQPIICVRNDKPVLRKDWDKPVGMSQDPIRFVQIPRGETIKNLLQLVAIVALSVVAPYVGALVGGGILGGLASAAFVLGGTFLINAFLGTSASLPKNQTAAQASPTYSLDAQGNRARILNPIPRLYGTHIMYPDFASQPYQSYESNEQYLYQLFCLGVGEYQVEKINIDKTELWNRTTGLSESFSDVALEIVPPGQKVTLFPSNVITSSEVSGQELRNETFTAVASFSGNRVTLSAAQPIIEYLAPGDQIIIQMLPTAGTAVGSSGTASSVNNRLTFSSAVANVALIPIGATVTVSFYTGAVDTEGNPVIYSVQHVVAAKDAGNTWVSFTSSFSGFTGAVTSPSISFTYTPTSPNAGTFNITDKDTTEPLTWLEFGTTFTTATNVNIRMTLDNWVGPFVANPNNEATNLLKVDIVLGRGLYYANDKGGLSNASVTYQIQARRIDNLGNPISSYSTLLTQTITKNTSTPQRYTKSFDVALGRYEVRLRRTNVKQHDTRYGNEISWAALRAFIPDDNIFADVTLLAIKIRASNQLSQQSSTQINVIQSGKIPVWNGTTWSAPVVNNNPSWVAADILRNTVYGASIPDDRIDIAKLYDLAQIYTARGDSFNGVFDSTKTLWDALTSVLNVVRSQPILIAGKITFVRDQPRSLARTVITPQSVLKNTFEMNHILKGEDSADDVIVEFMDQTTWEQSEVQATLPGSSSSKPARLQMFGVTNRSQAWREGMYLAASNAYRRVLASVSTEADGRLLLKGDPVIVSHDVPQWSDNGFVMEYLPTERVLVLDRQVNFSSGENIIILRRRDGKEFGPIDVVTNGYDNEVVLEAGSLAAVQIAQGININDVLSIDDEAKRTTYVFVAGGEQFVKRFIVVGATMRDLNLVDLSLAIDDPRVYTADTGTPPPGVDYLGPGVTPNGPPIDSITVFQDPFSGTDPVTLVVGWTVAMGATQYILQHSVDGISWEQLYAGTSTSTNVTVGAGTVYLRVAAVGTTLGPWKTFTGSFGTPSLLPGTVSNLVAMADVESGVIEVTYDAAPRTTSYDISIYKESVTSSGNFDTLVLSKNTTSTFVSWNSTEVTTGGGPWSRIEVRVTASNTNGSGGTETYQVLGIGLGSVTNLSLSNVYNGTEAAIQWSPVNGASGYRIKIYNNVNTLVREVLVTSTTYFYSNAQLIADGGPWRTFSARVRAESSSLTGPEATLAIEDLAPPYPSNIVSSSPSAGALTITWDQVMEPDVTGYIVYASTTNGFTPGSGNKLFEGNALGMSATGLTAGTYYYRVLTKDSYVPQTGFNISPQASRVVT